MVYELLDKAYKFPESFYIKHVLYRLLSVRNLQFIWLPW